MRHTEGAGVQEEQEEDGSRGDELKASRLPNGTQRFNARVWCGSVSLSYKAGPLHLTEAILARLNAQASY